MTATTQSLEPDLSGYVLDRYRLTRCLGVGGMGAVYEAEHTALGKRVAVKLLRQQLSMHEIARKRFLREARAATRVEHPHVVDISDFGETSDGRVYFVMELLPGRDLGQLLEAEGRLPWPRAQDLLLQTVSALGAAHAHGIVHRDMKPSNCFLVDVPGLEGRDFIKVLDFGIAKLSGKHGEETQGLTSTDEVFGTVGYMAPEMAMGVSDDPRSDVYAMGVMMYRMLVGELPFEGGTAFQILARHVGEQPVLPRAKDPAIPEGVERIILRAMAKHPEERFATMQELGEAIRRGDVGPETGASRSLVDATIRMDNGMSRERMAVERTASLSMVGIGTGPWPSVGRAGGTEVITSGGGLASRPISRSAMAMAMRGVDVEEDVREVEEDERGDDELVHEVRTEGARGRVLLVVGILLAMGAVLAAVALMLAPSGDSRGEPVAVIPRERRVDAGGRGNVELKPVAVPDPEESQTRRPPRLASEEHAPEASRKSFAPPSELEEPPESAVGPEEEPPTHSPHRPETSSGGRTVGPRLPRGDAAVATRIRKKIVARCRSDGGTKITIEGIIGTGGRVLSPIVSPSMGPGACVERIAKTIPFAPGEEVRAMPVISVDL